MSAESLKLERCDMCGTIAMPDPTVGCRTCGWDEMRPIIQGERLHPSEALARLIAERDEARLARDEARIAAAATVKAFADQVRDRDDDYIYDTLGSMQSDAYFKARAVIDKARNR